MKSICETEYFGREALRILEQATFAVSLLPDGEDLRCHEVARAVGSVLSLRVVDGKFGPVEHSWCSLVDMTGSVSQQFILDVYAVGRLPVVQLLDATSHATAQVRALFRPGDVRDDIDTKLVQELQEIIRASPRMVSLLSTGLLAENLRRYG